MFKKIFTFVFAFLVVANFTMASETLKKVIDDNDLGAKLSNGVSGTYAANNDSGNPTQFAISTGHAQGNKVYATGSFTTTIYTKDSSDPFVSTDLLGDPSAFDSSANFISNWTAIGE